MITGRVLGHKALIRLKVRGPEGQEKLINAIVDTGYTESLALPKAFIKNLGLDWHDVGHGFLADGSESKYDVYRATIVWDRKALEVYVDEMDIQPLVGMALLSGYELSPT